MIRTRAITISAFCIVLACAWACGGPTPAPESDAPSTAAETPATADEAASEVQDPGTEAEVETVADMDFEDGKVPEAGEDSDTEAEEAPAEDPAH